MNNPPQNEGLLIFLRNWTENTFQMSNFFKLRKNQTFGLIELHNLSRGQLADSIWKVMKKLCSRLPGRRTYNFWNSVFLIFPTFKRLPGYKQSLKVLIKFYRCTNTYNLKFSTMKQWCLKFFWKTWIFLKNLHGRTFCFLTFVKWGKY